MKNKIFAGVFACLMAICVAAVAQNTLVYFPQGGATLEVKSGGIINVQTGGAIKYNGVASTGVIKSGTVTLDGSNPTPVTTGLTTVVTGLVSMKSTATPGDDPVYFTVDYSGGTLNVYAWKNTTGTDPTLVASTNNTVTIDWVAVGS